VQQIEEFLTLFYNKIILYLKTLWSDIVAKYEAFDFTLLLKIGFVLLIGYLFAKTFSRHIPKLIAKLGAKINYSVDDDFIHTSLHNLNL